ncbi:MAG: aminotransferase class V-fold PLP-dependent enzyme [Dehalococcoidia bacterium]|nr:aminotransferase class V-fold PLP-dependent enzyme [Dehalococcoidia bacterium]
MNEIAEAFTELERGVQAALETYSNVHRGSGHNSLASTHLFEQARDIVLEYLGLNKDKYVVIFSTPRRAELIKALLKPKSYQIVSSQDMGLPLGVRALVVERKALPRGVPFQTGGGTARLVSPEWVIWAKAPDKFEAGTPAIVNVIAFARALHLIQHFGKDAFQDSVAANLAAAEILYHDELEQYSGQELLAELKQALIGRSVRVPTVEGARPYINLDNGASTPTFTPIWNAVCQTWRQPRQVQQEIIHEVKSICAGVLGAPLAAYDVIFTSNTTEAINLTAESLGNESEQGIESVVLNTLLEHNSNELPWRMIPGFSLVRLPVDAEGFMDLNELETLLCAYNQKGQHGRKRIKLVAVSGASNVLGVCNNLAEISRIAHRDGARLLVDAAQLVAHRKVEMEGCGIDYLAFSAHKVYAPFGSGVLLVRKGLLNFSAAELELIRSSGEENVGGIAALGKALVLLQRIGLDLIQEEEQALTGRALRGLAQIPGLRIYGVRDPDSPRFAQKGGVIVFGLKGIMANRVAKELAERGGIGVRYGCHCAHLLIKRLLSINPLLARMQGLILTLFPRIVLPGLVRVSLGIENSEEDVDTLIHVLGKIARQPQTGRHRHIASTRDGTPISPQEDVQQQMNDFARAVARRVYTQLK